MASISYQFDPTGRLAANLIQNETQALTSVNNRNYFLVIPSLGPFFANDKLSVSISVNGNVAQLTEGQDYVLALPYVAATRAIGQVIYGGLCILNTSLNATALLTYQTLGGAWTADRETILENLAEKMFNPRVTSWDLVTDKQDLFPPINHSLAVENVYGQEELIAAILRLSTEVGTADKSALVKHMLDVNNPHLVTKDQVNLGHVENLPVATLADVENKRRLRKYITLEQVVGLIEEVNAALVPASSTYTVSSVTVLGEGT